MYDRFKFFQTKDKEREKSNRFNKLNEKIERSKINQRTASDLSIIVGSTGAATKVPSTCTFKRAPRTQKFRQTAAGRRTGVAHARHSSL